MMKSAAIGIDLGLSSCCVGVVLDGKLEIIENERGNKTTPSYVAFTDRERLVGEEAKDQAALNPANTVFGLKRIIGRTFADHRLDSDLKNLPYVTTRSAANEILVRVMYKNERQELLPEQICAMLLTKQKELAEKHLGCPVTAAVISVPSCFTSAQRQATRDAAAIAGLHVLRLINEPTASALAYQSCSKTSRPRTVAVVDFGGGKLEVSIITVKKNKITVRATHGNSNFGGTDIDNMLVDHCISQFRHTHKIDITNISKARERMRRECDRLKRNLSLLRVFKIDVDNLQDGIDCHLSLSRVEFEEMTSHEIRAVLSSTLEGALQHANARPRDIDRVLLVGGSTRLLCVQKLLAEQFSEVQLDKSLNPDEAVALGAALQAAYLTHADTIPEVIVKDVCSHDYVVHNAATKSLLLAFNKGIEVPNCRSETCGEKEFFSCLNSRYVFAEKNDSEDICQRDVLGEFRMSDLTTQQCFGAAQLRFTIDADGVFSASVLLNDSLVRVTSTEFSKRDETHALQEMIDLEKHYQQDTQNELDRISALNDLESFCFSHRSVALDHQCEMSESACHQIRRMCDDIISWIDDTPSAGKQGYVEKKKELQRLLELTQFPNSSCNIGSSVASESCDQKCTALDSGAAGSTGGQRDDSAEKITSPPSSLGMDSSSGTSQGGRGTAPAQCRQEDTEAAPCVQDAEAATCVQGTGAAPCRQYSGPVSCMQDMEAASYVQDAGSTSCRQGTGAAPCVQDTGAAPCVQKAGAAPYRQDAGSTSCRQDTGAAPCRQDSGPVPCMQDMEAAPYVQDTGVTPHMQDAESARCVQDTESAPCVQDTGAAPCRQDTDAAPHMLNADAAPCVQDTGAAPCRQGSEAAPHMLNTEAAQCPVPKTYMFDPFTPCKHDTEMCLECWSSRHWSVGQHDSAHNEPSFAFMAPCEHDSELVCEDCVDARAKMCYDEGYFLIT